MSSCIILAYKGFLSISPRVSSITTSRSLNHLHMSSFSTVQRPLKSRVTDLSEYFQHANNQVNPFDMVKDDTVQTSRTIREVIGSDHPIMRTVAGFFFDSQTNRTRPTLVFLLSHILADMSYSDVNGGSVASNSGKGEVSPRLKLLSEITELIHVSMTLHNKVEDDAIKQFSSTSFLSSSSSSPSPSAREQLTSLPSSLSLPAISAMMGKKLVLGGDLLFARVVVALHQLQNHDVTQLMTVSLEQCVTGEIMALKDTCFSRQRYEQIAFCRNGSLMAHALQSVSILSGGCSDLDIICFDIGKYSYLAGRVADDINVYNKIKPSTASWSLDVLSQMPQLDVANVVLMCTAEVSSELRDILTHATDRANAIASSTKVDLILGVNTTEHIQPDGLGAGAGTFIQLTQQERSKVFQLIDQHHGERLAKEYALDYAAKALKAIYALPECQYRAGMVQVVKHLIERKE